MSKLPYMQFYVADWLLDTQFLSSNARGIWIDILAMMWRSEPRTGTLSFSTKDWCKRLRCTEQEWASAMDEFLQNLTCKIVLDPCNELVSLTSRRIEREENCRTSNKLYMRNYRQKLTCKDLLPLGKRENQNQNQNQNQNKEEEIARQVSKKPTKPTLADDEWLEELKKNPAYSHIDFSVQNGKMDAWLSLPQNKNRAKSRKFILNWLNRVEKPVHDGAMPPSQGCKERIFEGNFLVDCKKPAVTIFKGRPLCQEHKDYHERKASTRATR